MPIVGGLDIHRKQITFDYLDTATGEVKRGQIAPADRAHLRAWLARFAGRDDVAFALEGCTGWRYVAEELAAAGVTAHVAEPADTAFARGRKRHAKTDPAAPQGIAGRGPAAGVLDPAVGHPGVPGAAGDLPRPARRAHRPGAAARCSSTRGFRPSHDRPTAPRPAARTLTGFPCFARVRETRLDLGALCTPGAAVSARPVIVPGRRLPHLNGQPPSPWTATRPRM